MNPHTHPKQSQWDKLRVQGGRIVLEMLATFSQVAHFHFPTASGMHLGQVVLSVCVCVYLHVTCLVY